MAPTWDAQMQERFDSLEGKVDSLGTRVESLEGKVDSLGTHVESLEGKVDSLGTRVESLETKVDNLSERVDHRFETVDHRFETVDRRFDAIDKRFDDLEDRLNRKIDVQMDVVRDLLKKSAEGYSATLEAISRKLTAMQGNMRRQHDDVLRMLANHEERITVLEKSRRRRSH